MSTTCPECGAPVPEGGSCRDNFHALLLLEWEIPGGPGSLAHFYAVSSYGLQHPESMHYTAEALTDLLAAVAAVLNGTATINEIRERAGRSAGRVTRREGDAVLRWPVDRWATTVVDVTKGDVAGYGERVAAWARSVITTLDAQVPGLRRDRTGLGQDPPQHREGPSGRGPR